MRHSVLDLELDFIQPTIARIVGILFENFLGIADSVLVGGGVKKSVASIPHCIDCKARPLTKGHQYHWRQSSSPLSTLSAAAFLSCIGFVEFHEQIVSSAVSVARHDDF
jgi:hypothetical protein